MFLYSRITGMSGACLTAGYMDGGLDTVAPAVDSVLTEAMNRLKAYVETGGPGQG